MEHPNQFEFRDSRKLVIRRVGPNRIECRFGDHLVATGEDLNHCWFDTIRSIRRDIGGWGPFDGSYQFARDRWNEAVEEFQHGTSKTSEPV